MYGIFLSFTLIHAIIVIRGNGAPKIICSIPEFNYLMPVGCDLSNARNGTYNYYVGKGDLYLVNKIDKNGLFIKLKIRDRKIIECNLFEEGEIVKLFYIPCNYVSNANSDGSYQLAKYVTQGLLFEGFDGNGNVIGGTHASIPKGTSLLWGIVSIILLP